MPEPSDLTALILEVFRLNGTLLAEGDRLVRDLGLTSARWQVLGAVALAEAPLTVAGIARAMGLTRQSVRRTVGELQASGLVVLQPNPAHRRAGLVALTPAGAAAYAAADARQHPWADALAKGIGAAEVAAATDLLRALRRRLDPRDGGETR
jgi:DNA-binding MarR family transcriptional regulator